MLQTVWRINLTPPPFYTTDTIIYGQTLTPESAENILDIICYSALKTIASKTRLDITVIRERAIKKNISFTQVVDTEAVLTAGTKSFNPHSFRIVPASKEEYVHFIHSFIRPPSFNKPRPTIS